MRQPTCGIFVLNYNGKDLLEKCLGSVVVATAACRNFDFRIVVVDNRSTDDSVDWIRGNYPDVEVIVAPNNDFLFSLNPVMASRQEEFVVILNNDMWVASDFLDPLLQHFADPALFAATCGIRDWDGQSFNNHSRPPICTVRAHGSWYEEVYEPAPNIATEVQLASGGASAYRRARFVDLGGFDPLFRPGYSEDMDLSIRAWRRGWKIIYEPSSIVHHLGSVSMKRSFGTRIRRISLRNRLLLTAKLLGSRKQNGEFLALYVKRAIQHSLWGNRDLGKAMWLGLPRLPRALWGRCGRNRAGDPISALPCEEPTMMRFSGC